jgi:hypothetical protein
MDTHHGGNSTGSNDDMHYGTSPEKQAAFAEAPGPQSSSKAMAPPYGEVKIERVGVAVNRASALSLVHQLLMNLFD